MTTMEEGSPNDATIKERTTLDGSITEDRTTTNMTAGGSNKDKPTDNVLHDEDKYGNKQNNANKSANTSNKATLVNTIIIAVTAQRVLKEGAQGKRVHSRRVHKPGGRVNSMNIVVGAEELSYTPTIVAA